MPVDTSLIQAILANAGVGIAVAFILVLLGLLVPGYAYKRAQREIDRRDQIIDRLRDTLETERRQQAELVRAGGLTNQLIEALARAAGHAPEPDEPGGKGPGRRTRRHPQ